MQMFQQQVINRPRVIPSWSIADFGPCLFVDFLDVRAELTKTQELALNRWQARAVTETLATCSTHFTTSISGTFMFHYCHMNEQFAFFAVIYI